MQAITVTRPVLEFAEVQLDRYNSRAFVAGKHMFSPMNIVFEDDISGTATQIIQEQLQHQQHLIGAEGPFLAAKPEGSLYKFATYLDLLDGGTSNITEKWIVEGCYLSNVDWTDLNYAASEAVTINVTIRYDHARQEMVNGYKNGKPPTGEGVATGGTGKSTTITFPT